jgi:hypothetical protein
MMNVILSSDLVSRQQKIRDQIAATAWQLPAAARDDVFLGTWSVKDLIAHLIGWDYANTAAISEILAGQLPSFYQFADRDWQCFNAKLVAQYSREGLEDLLQDLRASQTAFANALLTLPESELNSDHAVRYKGWKVTIGRLIQAELGDEEAHLEQLSEFVRKFERLE